MKKCLSGLLGMTAMFLAAADYQIKVFNDANRNGVWDSGEQPLPGIVVSNYTNLAITDTDGKAVLPVEDNYNMLWVHEPTGFRAVRRYQQSAGGNISFSLHAIPVKKSTKFIQLADTESNNLSNILPEVKSLAAKLNTDFILVSGDLCRFPGIAIHADTLNEKTMDCEVIYTIGNHDIVSNQEDGTNYQDYLGPYWYSFERNNLLFIALPMHYGEVEMPYDLKDFGDWLKKLLAILPADQKIVLLGHNLPGQQMPPVIPSNSGNVELGNRLAGVFFGHWHMNMVLHDPNGNGSAYCVANPNKAGIDHDPATIRFAEIADNGQVQSRLIWTDYKGYVRPTAFFKALPKTSAESLQFLNSTTHNAYFPQITADKITPAWVQQIPQSFQYSTPLLMDNFLYIGVADDAEGLNGGVIKVNASTGKIAGGYNTGYSVRNSLAADGQNTVFGSDVRGNVFAINADTMKPVFTIPATRAGVPPVMNGVTLENNVLYAGLCTDLKAIDTTNGNVLWQNSAWKGSHTFNGVLTLTDDLVISVSNWRGVFANRRDNGELSWQRTERNMIYNSATPVYADGKLWVKSGTAVYVLNPADGSEINEFKISGADVQSAAPVVVLPECLIVATSKRGIVALDKNTGSELWSFEQIGTALADAYPYAFKTKTVEAPVVVTAESVWFGAADGVLYQLDVKTGKQKSAINLGSQVLSAPLIFNDRLYITTAAGNLYAFELK